MSSDEEEVDAPAKGMSKSIGLRMQKKLLGAYSPQIQSPNMLLTSSHRHDSQIQDGRESLHRRQHRYSILAMTARCDHSRCLGGRCVCFLTLLGDLLDNLYELALKDLGEVKLAKKVLKVCICH